MFSLTINTLLDTTFYDFLWTDASTAPLLSLSEESNLYRGNLQKSLPILLAIRNARGKDKQKIMKVFGKSNAAKKDVQTAVNIIRSLGIEEEVRKKALQYATKATRSLDSYSGSDKKEMVCLLDFVVKRSL